MNYQSSHQCWKVQVQWEKWDGCDWLTCMCDFAVKSHPLVWCRFLLEYWVLMNENIHWKVGAEMKRKELKQNLWIVTFPQNMTLDFGFPGTQETSNHVTFIQQSRMAFSSYFKHTHVPFLNSIHPSSTVPPVPKVPAKHSMLIDSVIDYRWDPPNIAQ